MQNDIFRPLTAEELPALYPVMERQFPDAELKPLSGFLRAYRAGTQMGFVLEQSGKIICYALLVQAEGVASVQLDYFAVSEELQGQGVGSRMLGLLRRQFPQLIADVEDPEAAESTEEARERSRRVRFYERNGFRMTRAKAYAWGVDYAFMATAGDDGEVARAMDALYRTTTATDAEYRAHFRVYVCPN